MLQSGIPTTCRKEKEGDRRRQKETEGDTMLETLPLVYQRLHPWYTLPLPWYTSTSGFGQFVAGTSVWTS